MRPPSSCCLKRNWSKEEDAKIVAYVSNHGTPKWTALPKIAGVNRCGKCCKIRWTNYLKPSMENDDFTPEEEDLIVKLHASIGSRWNVIAKLFKGKTEKDVKKHWKSKLSKKLREMGIDPLTHKPFTEFRKCISIFTTSAPTQQATEIQQKSQCA